MISLLSHLWISLALALAGGDGSLVRNGGDTVVCAASAGAPFVGNFTLDYLLDYRTTGPLSELAPVDSWPASSARISRELHRLSPILAESFDDFTSQVFHADGTKAWIPANLDGEDTLDQQIDKRLPDNCYRTVGGSEVPNLRQTVIRRYEPRRVTYLYQKDILDDQLAHRPLQFSFFLVHEWLWDLTQNARDLRRLNWILHGAHLGDTTPNDLLEFFRRTSFFSRELPACHRSEVIRSALEKAFGKSCETISAADLNGLETLDLSSPGRTEFTFRAGDFSQLYGLKTLNLAGNIKVLSHLPPYAFADLVSLEVLILHGADIGPLPEHLTEGVHGVRIE